MMNYPTVLSSLACGLVAVLASSPAFAQLGDRPGDEPQVASRIARELPPAAVLTPEQSLASFRVADGFRIELVAAEPMVHDPVALCFDPQGNLWVAEMSGFNAGIVRGLPGLVTGETAEWPTGKIVTLEDTDGDGRMDRRTVFLDNLKSPRALAVLREGVLVADPPHVWFARDTDGDGKADQKEIVATDYGREWDGEASANGLLWGRDNWIHNVSHGTNFRFRGGKWETEPIAMRGQFGLSQDDFGRLFFNRNSDQLRGDLFGPRYGPRNPHAADYPWVNHRIANGQTVWPGRPTPGVNRGYRTGFLRDDGSLVDFTAACSPLVYRGTNFPDGFYNNVFVCEPAANLVKRNVLHEESAIITAGNAYEGFEFLTSTDERFRPVALANTPQGDLYIADMYRGILEEYHLITTYLRDQIQRRELETPLFGLGRIWRVRHVGGPVEEKPPSLTLAPLDEVAEALAHPGGWWRDTAQQVLVERGDGSVVPVLTRMAAEASDERTRVAALWTLEGLEALVPDVGRAALRDASPRVRAAAVRLHEPWLRGPDADRHVAQLAPLAKDPAAEVTVQLALSLGEARTPAALKLMHQLLLAGGGHPFMAKALASGLAGREFAFIEEITAGAEETGWHAGIAAMLSVLAEAVAREGEPGRVRQLLAHAGDAGRLPEWARLAVIEGLEALLRPAVRRAVAADRLLRASMLEAFVDSANPAVAARAGKLAAGLRRLEAQQADATHAAVTLSGEGIRLYEEGKTAYALCASCHQESGAGLPGLAPALLDSPWVTGSPEPLIRIILHGKEGTPGYPGAMPPLASLPDEQLAAVLTYIRNSWGLRTGAIDAAAVADVRKATAGREAAWTETELKQAAANFSSQSR